MINPIMAAIAANYSYQWVIRGEMTSLATAVTLEPPAMTSRWPVVRHRSGGVNEMFG